MWARIVSGSKCVSLTEVAGRMGNAVIQEDRPYSLPSWRGGADALRVRWLKSPLGFGFDHR
jgi:hypothetical protein